MLSDGFVIIIKQLSITSDTRVWLRKKKTRFLMHGGGGGIKTAKAQHQCWNLFAANSLWTLNRHFITTFRLVQINQWPFPRLVINTHFYRTYIKQCRRQNKFYGSSSLNLICSRNAERKPLNIAIKLVAPSGDCYNNDVTIEADPGVFLTLGGATVGRGSELQA